MAQTTPLVKQSTGATATANPLQATSDLGAEDNYGLNPVDPSTTGVGSGTYSGIYNSINNSYNNSVETGNYGTGTSSPTGASLGGASTNGGGGLLSGLSSLLGSNAGQLGLYGGLYALEANQASNAESENNTLAGQISAIGAPAVGESQNLLGAYSSGQLTTPYQEQVQASENANQNAATSQSQSAAQALANTGGQNTSSALNSQEGQIQNAQNQANTAAISNAFQNELSSSDTLLSAGGTYVQSGVQQEIASNTQLQGQLSSLMSNLASAYAQSVSGTKAAASPSTTPKTPSLGSGSGSGAGTGSGSGGDIGSGDQLTPQNPYAYYTSQGGTGLTPINPDTAGIGTGDYSNINNSIDSSYAAYAGDGANSGNYSY